jgi:O-antigen ligase
LRARAPALPAISCAANLKLILYPRLASLHNGNHKNLDTSFSQSTHGEISLPADRRSRVLTLLDRVIFYGLIALIVLTAFPYGTVDPWSEALFEGAVFFFVILWIVHGLIDGSWQIGGARLIAPLVGLIVLAVVQSIAWWQVDSAGEKVRFALSADPFETRAFAFRMAALVLALALVLRFTSDTKRLGILVHTIIAVALASALFGITRQATQHGPGFVLSRLLPESGYAQFINKNHFAFLMEMALGLVIGVALMQRGRRERLLLYLSGAVLMWAAVVLSNSRGGLLTITVQVIFAALIFVHSRPSAQAKDAPARGPVRWMRSIAVTAVMTGTLLVIIVAGVAWLGGDQLSTGVETATLEMAGVDRSEIHVGARRRDIWRATWLMFKGHPIAGAGLGGFWAEVPIFHQASGAVTPQQAHNDYLELLASGGILGAALFTWFAAGLIREARHCVNTVDGFQRAASWGAIIGLVGVGVHSIVDFGLHITVNALAFMMLVAILGLKSFGSQVVRKAVRSVSPA